MTYPHKSELLVRHWNIIFSCNWFCQEIKFMRGLVYNNTLKPYEMGIPVFILLTGVVKSKREE